MNHIEFDISGNVFVNPVLLDKALLKEMETNSLLFFTGITRDASSILAGQREKIISGENHDNLIMMNQLVKDLKKDLNNRDLSRMGEILRKSWELKKGIAANITNNAIEDFHERGMNAGAIGGKILGAGGGGFLFLYCEPSTQEKVRKHLSELMELDFKFEREGSKIIYARE